MKELPDQKILNELLELAKDAFQEAREMNDLADKLHQKYKKRLIQISQDTEQAIKL